MEDLCVCDVCGTTFDLNVAGLEDGTRTYCSLDCSISDDLYASQDGQEVDF